MAASNTGDRPVSAPIPANLLAPASLKTALREAVARDPMEASLITVLGGAFLFYLAEHGKNPKVTSYWDALVFVSTCMSVGYADVFAKTPAGKAIAAVVMTFGPALSGALLDAPEPAARSGSDALREAQDAIVAKLDEVIRELRNQKTGSAAP